MPRLVLFLVPFVSVCLAAENAPAKPVAKTKRTPAVSAVQPRPLTAVEPVRSATPTIPAGAVEIEPYLYRYTDKDGKTWLYRKTPFGITKFTEQAGQDVAQRHASAAANQSKVRAIDIGDTVRFERATAMGVQTWEKKKSDLTAEEKGWLEQSGTQAAARPEK